MEHLIGSLMGDAEVGTDVVNSKRTALAHSTEA
jgi:hypothetical protein